MLFCKNTDNIFDEAGDERLTDALRRSTRTPDSTLTVRNEIVLELFLNCIYIGSSVSIDNSDFSIIKNVWPIVTTNYIQARYKIIIRLRAPQKNN